MLRLYKVFRRCDVMFLQVTDRLALFGKYKLWEILFK